METLRLGRFNTVIIFSQWYGFNTIPIEMSDGFFRCIQVHHKLIWNGEVEQLKQLGKILLKGITVQ